MTNPSFKNRWLLPITLACGSLLVLCAGCGQSEARFHLDMIAMAKNKVSEEQQQQIANILTAMFGTPDDPYVLPESGLDIDKLRLASGPVHRDPIEGKKGLYREHCVHCHGISGGGDGPTAAFLNPYPRDYRRGWFKEKSTKLGDQPTTDDLLRTVYEGIPGTAMPSFKLLPKPHREALIEYVKYLSLRGQMEQALAREVKDELGPTDLLPDDRAAVVAMLKTIVKKWNSPTSVVVLDRPEDMKFERIKDDLERKRKADFSIAMGHAMFLSDKTEDPVTHKALTFPWKSDDGAVTQVKYVGAGCIKCHGPTAMGDGQTGDYDDWTKEVWDNERWERKKGLMDPAEVMPLGALPLRNIIPRNLRIGIFRFGRRPLDLYYRFHEGIKGTPMPAVASVLYAADEGAAAESQAMTDFVKANPEPAKKSAEKDADFKARKDKWDQDKAAAVAAKKAELQSERIWNLVDFVQALPYEPGGELGADAAVSKMDSNMELHAR